MTSLRIGHGYDIHRFVPARRLVLGGVTLEHPFGLDGHSDADALTHAVCDALLGAAGERDIGHHFPNQDPRWKDADSLDLLAEVVRRLRAAGWSVVNVDATVVAEAPRIGPHVAAMRARLAPVLGVEPGAVGIKATTNEGVGAIGRREALAAFAVALIAR